MFLEDVWLEDGIRFKSRDGSFEGRLGGRFLAHYRAVFDRPQETVGAAPMKDVPNTIFARQARITSILTGEDKRPEERIVPKGDCGAVELGFRVASLNIDDAFTSGVFTQPGNSNSIYAYTFGVNWWVTRNVRFTLDVIREPYNDPITFDTGRTERMLMGMIFRGQVDF